MIPATPTLHRFDRWGARVGTVRPLSAAVHAESLGGSDVLTLETADDISKGDRLVWRDGDGWREHVVSRTSQGLDGVTSVRCEGSLCELEGDYIEQVYLRGADAEQALSAALAVTRWGLEVQGDVSGTITCWLYHTDALSAVLRIADELGLEVSCRLETDGMRITSRTVVVSPRLGGWAGARFDYGRNLASCRRTVLEDSVVTALYGYGAGLPVVDEYGAWHGGYSRKLTFGSVNGGVDWVGDEDAREAWGRPGADGTSKEHVFGEAVFSECEDARELLEFTRAELARRSAPRVTYVVEAARVEGCPGLGDDVLVTDPLFSGGRILERCVRRVRTFGQTLSCELTLGDAERGLSEIVEDLGDRVVAVESAVASVSDEVATVGSEVFSEVEDPESGSGSDADAGADTDEDTDSDSGTGDGTAEGEPRARALLLDDGTLELTYLADNSSPSGGTVSQVFDIVACESYGDLPWKGVSKQITAARFDPSFASSGVASIAYFFYTCSSLASVSGMGNLSGVADMDYAFASCSSLASLDLRGMTLGEGVSLKMAFGSCTSLEAITADADWELPTVSDGYATFYNCRKLVGGNGTAYASSRISASYMVVDTDTTAGYLTAC